MAFGSSAIDPTIAPFQEAPYPAQGFCRYDRYLPRPT